MKRKKRTAEQKTEIVERIKALNKAGTSIRSATEQAGITQGMYYDWLERFGSKRKVMKAARMPEMITVQLPPEPAPLSAGEVREFARIMITIFGRHA